MEVADYENEMKERVKRWLKKLVRYRYVILCDGLYITDDVNTRGEYIKYNAFGVYIGNTGIKTNPYVGFYKYEGTHNLQEYFMNLMDKKSFHFVYNCKQTRRNIVVCRDSINVMYDAKNEILTICDQESRVRTNNTKIYYKMCEIFKNPYSKSPKKIQQTITNRQKKVQQDIIKHHETLYKSKMMDRIRLWLKKLVKYRYMMIVTTKTEMGVSRGRIRYNGFGIYYEKTHKKYNDDLDIMTKNTNISFVKSNIAGVSMYEYCLDLFNVDNPIHIVYNCNFLDEGIIPSKNSTRIIYNSKHTELIMLDNDVTMCTDNINMYNKMCRLFKICK